jgi:Ca2+:H+ antiporter
VLAAVHHAEVVAHRIGEPFGSLVLAVAVTVIEVALIVTLMVSGGPETASLARDTAFAAVMITTNGIVGISLLLGALRYGVTLFNAEGSGAALATVATLATLATLSLVLPTFTTSQPGPEFSPAQLTFAALAALALYGMFVLTQTVRHRDFFLPVTPHGVAVEGAFGSAMASIGLTIPVIALASVWLEGPLLLGLGSTQMVLLALTVVVSVLTVVPGRATRLQGGVHLVLLAAFLFLAINP